MFAIIRDPQTVRNRSILVRGSLNILFYAETYSENLYVYQNIFQNSAFIIQHHLLRLPKWPLEPQNGPKSKLFVALSCTLHRAICIDYCRVSKLNKKWIYIEPITHPSQLSQYFVTIFHGWQLAYHESDYRTISEQILILTSFQDQTEKSNSKFDKNFIFRYLQFNKICVCHFQFHQFSVFKSI